ncbi:MAG: cytochrome C [Magnetococcales bacterium]|nr:cytochrome C [Magnetococcales bacterium]
MRLYKLFVLLAMGIGIAKTAHADLDATSALEVLKRNDCTKCHSIQKSKNGPSYIKVAKKYKEDPKGEEKLFKHLTTTPKVKLEDGTEEDHKKTDFENPEHLKEFIRWILSL